ncbi:hypothetical protein TSUD_321440 [Trifolium subterraneum]|uniref:Uncharacterized protein n=1 Tax=Trifolium subterraneum TaxID=3900 RepID=A0A2Z6NAF1_TRISU|nr:hypothetical protein TSUD_321440 [Trifolium subterraneum]
MISSGSESLKITLSPTLVTILHIMNNVAFVTVNNFTESKTPYLSYHSRQDFKSKVFIFAIHSTQPEILDVVSHKLMHEL